MHTPSFLRYRKLEAHLIETRWKHQSLYSPDEDVLLEQMGDLWWELSDEEQALLRSEPPCSLILSEANVSLSSGEIESSPEDIELYVRVNEAA